MSDNEAIDIDSSDPAVIRIVHKSITDRGIDMGGKLVFDRSELPWVVEQLDSALNKYPYSQQQTTNGVDALTVYCSGNDFEAFVNLMNRRDKTKPHGGVYALMMPEPTAKRLLDLLRSA